MMIILGYCSIHASITHMLPVFECGLFEGRADVTEQVSETVTNWGRLCRTRIKHVFCRPEMKEAGEKRIHN